MAPKITGGVARDVNLALARWLGTALANEWVPAGEVFMGDLPPSVAVKASRIPDEKVGWILRHVLGVKEVTPSSDVTDERWFKRDDLLSELVVHTLGDAMFFEFYFVPKGRQKYKFLIADCEKRISRSHADPPRKKTRWDFVAEEARKTVARGKKSRKKNPAEKLGTMRLDLVENDLYDSPEIAEIVVSRHAPGIDFADALYGLVDACDDATYDPDRSDALYSYMAGSIIHDIASGATGGDLLDDLGRMWGRWSYEGRDPRTVVAGPHSSSLASGGKPAASGGKPADPVVGHRPVSWWARMAAEGEKKMRKPKKKAKAAKKKPAKKSRKKNPAGERCATCGAKDPDGLEHVPCAECGDRFCRSCVDFYPRLGKHGEIWCHECARAAGVKKKPAKKGRKKNPMIAKVDYRWGGYQGDGVDFPAGLARLLEPVMTEGEITLILYEIEEARDFGHEGEWLSSTEVPGFFFRIRKILRLGGKMRSMDLDEEVRLKKAVEKERKRQRPKRNPASDLLIYSNPRNPKKGKKKKVTKRYQEAPCRWCGYPLYIGDSFIWDEDEEEMFCSETCRKKFAGGGGREFREDVHFRAGNPCCGAGAKWAALARGKKPRKKCRKKNPRVHPALPAVGQEVYLDDLPPISDPRWTKKEREEYRKAMAYASKVFHGPREEMTVQIVPIEHEGPQIGLAVGDLDAVLYTAAEGTEYVHESGDHGEGRKKTKKPKYVWFPTKKGKGFFATIPVRGAKVKYIRGKGIDG